MFLSDFFSFCIDAASFDRDRYHKIRQASKEIGACLAFGSYVTFFLDFYRKEIFLIVDDEGHVITNTDKAWQRFEKFNIEYEEGKQSLIRKVLEKTAKLNPEATSNVLFAGNVSRIFMNQRLEYTMLGRVLLATSASEPCLCYVKVSSRILENLPWLVYDSTERMLYTMNRGLSWESRIIHRYSYKEKQIALLILQHYFIPQIAKTLGLNVNTVKSAVYKMVSELHLHSISSFVTMARLLKIV